MKQVYAVMMELYPRNEEEEPRVLLHNEVFETRAKAQDYIEGNPNSCSNPHARND